MREEWKRIRLKDITSKIGDGLHGTPKYDQDGTYFFINGNNLGNGKILLKEGTRKINHNEYLKIKKELNDRTVLVGINGTIGNVGLYSGEPVALGKSACYINILDDVSKKFIRYVLESDHFQEYANLFATGSTIKNLGLKAIREYEILLPPLHTQRKIASILSGYDDLIENNLKRIKLLEEKAQLTYEEWFVRMRFPGHETAVFNEETGLPEGWERKTLEELVDINSKSIKKDFEGVIDYIDIASVSPGRVENTTSYNLLEAPGRAKRIVEHGDIIWSCVRPNRKSYAVIWNPKSNLIASTGFCVLTPNVLPTSFLLQCVTTNDFVGYLTNRAGGAAYPAVKADDFAEAVIDVPPKYLIDEFDNVFGKSLEASWNLQNQNQLLKEARDILLPRLMSGLVSVEEMEGIEIN